jgi:hypothetical protein
MAGQIQNELIWILIKNQLAQHKKKKMLKRKILNFSVGAAAAAVPDSGRCWTGVIVADGSDRDTLRIYSPPKNRINQTLSVILRLAGAVWRARRSVVTSFVLFLSSLFPRDKQRKKGRGHR